jgi:cytochrome b pre-mRNA-processing protein 3
MRATAAPYGHLQRSPDISFFAVDHRTFDGMLQWLRQRTLTSRKAGEIYGGVVAAARQPAFYRDFSVPDTPEGRFELIALHLFLALENRKDQGPAGLDLTRRTIEAFVTDMDDCMREMGVGDLTVPKKVKRAAAAFYERAAAYRGGLSDGKPGGFEATLGNYVFAGGDAGRPDVGPETKPDVRVLARYVRTASAALATEPFEALVESGALARILEKSRIEVS